MCDPDEQHDFFATTQWSVVVAVRSHDEARARRALEQLCQCYWYPLYLFARRQGLSAHDAEDTIQEFLGSLLRTDAFQKLDRERGRCRAFLLAALKNFLANQRARAGAQKRGGGRFIISIDQNLAEGWYGAEPVDGGSPDRLYERRWAITLLSRVQDRLREEYRQLGQEPLFHSLKSTLTRHQVNAAEVGAKLGMKSGAVRAALHRMRKRYRDILRAEIRQTVASADEVEDEIRFLFRLFE